MNICLAAHIPIYSLACKAQVVKLWVDMPATTTHPTSQLPMEADGVDIPLVLLHCK